MEKRPEIFPADGDGEAANETPKNLFTSVEPESVSRAQIADRILSRILADLTAMREIVVRAAGASMRDEARTAAQRDIESLKGDIARLTAMLSRFSIDELGMTADEYAESMALIDRSIEEAADVVGKPRTAPSAGPESQSAGDEALSRWFDRITERSSSEEEDER